MTSSARPALKLALSATFTAEPLEDSLGFWLQAMGFDGEVEVGPYNQVFQQLLDPSSVLGRNGSGINLLLVRFEDWLRFAGGDVADPKAFVQQRFEELLSALRAHAARSTAPTWLWLGPVAAPRLPELYAQLEQRLQEELRSMGGQVALLKSPPTTPEIFDPRRDDIGHIPYTDAYFAALGSLIARRVHASKATPIKVIAIDCDNTLWQGVVGEDGPHGVTLPAGKLALQRALIAQQEQGVLLCLLSKNVEEDALEVFNVREDMLLKREHLVGWRINWLPKSQNIASLAQELNLGIDSFLFLDDNPVECGEMRAAQPTVATLQVPVDAELSQFVDNIWAFDRLFVTEEDRQRTRMYQENAARTQLEQQAGSIGDFLASLDLEIDVSAPAPEQIARVSQLTQRTNQFNFSTVRRSEAEISHLADTGLECLRVNVKDRFGDYGLVGVMIFGVSTDDASNIPAEQPAALRVLTIDSMMLSCRVLGRGVEHAMVANLGKVALARGASKVAIPFVPSKKNRPALDFLQSLKTATAVPDGNGTRYELSARDAAELVYAPGADAGEQLELARTGGAKASTSTAAVSFDRSAFFQRVANELHATQAVLQAIAQASTTARPQLDVAYVAPRNALETELAALWAKLLRVDQVGVQDDFAALGGTSLMTAAMFAEIDERHGVKLPMTVILEDSTIEKLAKRISKPDSEAAMGSLKPLRPAHGDAKNLFLVHDGDGETLLYVNLARRLPQDVAVYGIEPLGTPRVPIRHTRIEDMAQHYIAEIKRVQPAGPYLLAGMCAGGVLAFEMGLQLEAAGERVDLVGLLDSADPNTPKKVGLHSKRRLQSFVSSLRGKGAATAAQPHAESAPSNGTPSKQVNGAAKVAERARAAAGKVQNLIKYEANRQLTQLSSHTRFRMLRQVLDRRLSIPSFLQQLSVRTVYDLAALEYRPRARLRGLAVLFRATAGSGADEPFVQIYQDPQLGWAERVERALAVHEMPGGHGSMLQEPNVAVMAERMTELLARVRR